MKLLLYYSQIIPLSNDASNPIIPIQVALVLFLVLGSLFCVFIAIISWKQRPSMNAALISALTAAVNFYALGYCGELLSSDLPAMLRFVNIEYLGAATLPALWLMLAIFYANQIQWMKPKRLIFLWIIPVITLLAVFTNPIHHLYYLAASVANSGPFPTLSFVRGPLYWLQVAYAYGSSIGAVVLLLKQYSYSHNLYRKQATIMLIASLFMISITILHLVFVTPVPGLDINPFALIFSCLIMGLGIMRYKLIEINPIARDVLFEFQMDGVLVLDDQNVLVDFNPAARKILDLPPGSVGQSLRPLLSDEIGQVFDELKHHPMGLEIRVKNITTRFFDITLVPIIRKNHLSIGNLIVLHESTQRKETQLALERLNAELKESIKQKEITEHALRSSEDLYRLLAENSNDVIWKMDLEGHFIYISPAVERLRGFSPAEVLAQTINEIFCPESQFIFLDRIQRAIQMAHAAKGISPEYLEIEQPCKDGSTVWTETSIQLMFNEEHQPSGFVGISRDTQERKNSELKLRHDATHDALTGLPNRVLLLERLERSIETSRKKPEVSYSVFFLDIDEFKIINDSLGHFWGDQLLIAIGKRLRNSISSGDLITRLGGDEFVFLLENIKNLEEVKKIAVRIQEEIQQPYDLEGHRIFISASIGVIPSLAGYNQPEDILRDADITMYRAKSLGKARFEIFEPLLLNKAISRLEIEHDLRLAIELEKFKLVYQPIFSLITNQIVGFEALLRLENQNKSLSLPFEFIPIAEETGLIGPIGKWVLHEACSQAKKWQENFPHINPFQMNVNISSKQFFQPDFIEQVKQILQETRINANSLTMEITESVFIGNASKANTVFDALVQLGVQLQIDDFGTGYSSLRYIKHFPIDTIKIDQSFVKEINGSSKDADLVHAMVLMAHSLGMETIAEGIEDQGQLNELLRYGCHYGQGFLLSRPIDSRAVELMLENSLATVSQTPSIPLGTDR